MNVLSLNILLLVTANRQKENLFLNVSLLAATANHLLIPDEVRLENICGIHENVFK